DRVVDDFPNQVVQSALAGGTDVHAGAFADRFQPLQNRDGVGAVLFRILLLGSHGREALLGIAREQSDDSALVLCQSTVNTVSDRFCRGVSTQLSAPCARFFALGCVLTLDKAVSRVVTALSESPGGVTHRCRADPCRRCAAVPFATSARPGRRFSGCSPRRRRS